VKKGVVVILVLLAAIVLVSPAIVGRLAEQSMDENLNWAASESGELSVTSEYFNRGWFSSAGQHRIELRDGQLKTAVQNVSGPLPDGDMPVLLVNTRLDHGLIAVSSMSRNKGSLTPGLGSAVSTMQVELPDGAIIDLPGTIYSKVSLRGELQSNYVLEAGERSIDDLNASWGGADIDITTNPSSGVVTFDGTLDGLSAGGDQGGMGLSGLTFDGEQRPTRYGVTVGAVNLSLDEMAFDGGYGQAMRLSDVSIDIRSELDGDKINGNGAVSLMTSSVMEPGDMAFDMVFELEGADAAALGAVQRAIKAMNSSTDPMAGAQAIEAPAKDLLASGFTMNIPKYNLTLPQGTVSTQMSFTFSEEDPATFQWTTLLLSTDASVDVSLPAELVEMYAQGNPQAALIIGGGYLVKRGDVYVTEARLKKGLLTVNGAPIPIPLGM
jgi:uncharacterized protein YdgA (DUF945 family)